MMLALCSVQKWKCAYNCKQTRNTDKGAQALALNATIVHVRLRYARMAQQAGVTHDQGVHM